MPLLQANAVSYWIADRPILKDVSLTLDLGSRIALSGANGSGKSTFLKLLTGFLEPNGGNVFREKNSRIGYLPQSGLVHKGTQLWQEVEQAFEHYHELATRLLQIGEEIENSSKQLANSDPPTKNNVENTLKKLVEEQHHIQELLEHSGYYDRNREIEIILRGLGFSSKDFYKPSETFSGGWQMRIALAKILLSQPDVLLLDEPTNYLDLEAREWLQMYLGKYPGAVLMVSHDRYFLDHTIQAVAELYMGTLSLYKGSYSTYEKRRSLELEQLVRDYERQQDEIQKIEDFITRFRYNASKAAMVQSRVKSLEKIQRIEIPESLKKIHVSFPQAPRSGDITLRLTGIMKQYPEKPIFNGVDLEFLRGEKVALVGRNGAGKSTLMRIISGKDSNFKGEVHYGAEVVPAYFAQEAETQLTLSNTVIEEVEQAAPTEMVPKLRGLLGAFLFRGDDIHKPIAVLSGGEKNRVSLVKMLLSPANLLLLDEPTNHLDLASKDILLEALQHFSGTVLFVSHDHFFIQGLANRVVSVEAPDEDQYRIVKSYPGNYDYYRYRMDQESALPLERKDLTKDQITSRQEENQGKRDHKDLKQLRSMKKKLEKQEEMLLEEIDRLELAHAEIEHKMTLPENYADGDVITGLQADLANIQGRIKTLTQNWEEILQEKESIGVD